VQLYFNNISKGYYYDVNSLYPYAMLKPLPVARLKTITCSTDEFLAKDLFGFVECYIYISDMEKQPQVPVRYQGSLIYPVGRIAGCYFSEEVKSFIKLGYKVEILSCHQYSKEYNLFDDYVNHFYALKADPNISPENRHVVKLMLNGLYGYFARVLEGQIFKIVTENTLYK
jgi:hypothetical protein